MAAEQASTTSLAPGAVDVVDLPVLAARWFAPADVVEPQLRANRAELARLHLELRSALRVADQAQAEPPKAEVGPVAATLASNLRQHTERRRRELDEELASARAEATSLLADARAEAEREVTTARDATLYALLGASAVPEPTLAPPALHLVADAPAAPLPEPIVAPAVSAPVVGADVASSVLDPSSALAQQLAAAGVTTTGAVPIIVLPGAGAPPMAPAPAPAPAPLAAPTPEAPTSASPVTDAPPARDERPLWRRFLYLDVVLPAIAVLIVLIVLVAWMG